MKRISLPRVKMTIFTVFILLIASLLMAGCGKEIENSADSTKLATNVIYGSDGRLDLYQVTDDRLKLLADSTVALIRNSDLSVLNSSQVAVAGRNYGSDMNLCASEKYREQDTAAFCSGSLISPDLILTAGHCLETQSSCDNTAFVFGFAVKSVGVLPKTVSPSDVYRCRELVKTFRDNSGADFAIVKLDRTVSGHRPLAVRPVGDVTLTDSLVVIGHPVGLPVKIATGGTVRSISNANYFQANLDTYGGNSGSAVFNAQTGVIEGVLVRGEQDFESRGSCTVSKVCADGACRGEDVTKISAVRPFLPATTAPPMPPPAPPTPPAAREEIFSAVVNLNIPDNNKVGVTNTLLVKSIPSGRKVFVNLNITHTYIGDLVVKITAPDGNVITIHDRAGARTRNLVKSYEVTSQLGSVVVSGNYKITVQDLAAVDRGALLSWGVRFN